jgi:hypothetical protein
MVILGLLIGVNFFVAPAYVQGIDLDVAGGFDKGSME